ncbi:MAG: hypothetical protein JWO87_2358, partial [Phycisphaerales bacterium]|nr:hypothetical protein [Phycisphaerales bacterium]
MKFPLHRMEQVADEQGLAEQAG